MIKVEVVGTGRCLKKMSGRGCGGDQIKATYLLSVQSWIMKPKDSRAKKKKKRLS